MLKSSEPVVLIVQSAENHASELPGQGQCGTRKYPDGRNIFLQAADRKDGAELSSRKWLNCRMPSGTYGGVRGRLLILLSRRLPGCIIPGTPCYGIRSAVLMNFTAAELPERYGVRLFFLWKNPPNSIWDNRHWRSPAGSA